MKVNVYSVKDFRSGFNTPTFELNDAIAMRNFGNACLQQGAVINNFSEDFQLWFVGSFDTETGVFESSSDMLKPICKATDFVKRSVDNA